jgi:hypothetical protein
LFRFTFTGDLHFPFVRLALHWSHNSPDSGFSLRIRNLLWANGGNSSRNATRFGCACVDRFGSWSLFALSAGFWANFRAMVENTMEMGEIFEKALAASAFSLLKI